MIKSLRDTISQVESKILPVNQVEHRFRLEHLTFTMNGISLHAALLTSNGQDFSIQGLYSYSEKKFTEWVLVDHLGSEYQVVGIVSKTLFYFARRSTIVILEALGYEVME